MIILGIYLVAQHEEQELSQSTTLRDANIVGGHFNFGPVMPLSPTSQSHSSDKFPYSSRYGAIENNTPTSSKRSPFRRTTDIVHI